VLSDPRQLEGADPGAAELWRWHSAEEIEHKGVAYDTWLHVTRDWTRWKRWKVKTKVMLFVSRNFVVDRTLGALELMRQDGVTGISAWARLLGHMWVRPGVFRKSLVPWLKFFMPGFHPWNVDDRHLLAGYDASSDFEQTPRRKVRGAAEAASASASSASTEAASRSRISRAGTSTPRAQLSRGAMIPRASNPSFSSTRAEAGLSTKCEPSRLGKPSARAI
jgi:hypothetical protein